MVGNFIFSVLLLFIGVLFIVCIPFFGIKFCREDSEYPHGEDLRTIDNKTAFKDLLKGFPLWIWIICFFVFQGAITSILYIWCPSLLSRNVWSFLRFLAIFALFVYIILLNVTDDEGKIKSFKKSK